MLTLYNWAASTVGTLIIKGVCLGIVLLSATLFGDLPLHDFWFWTTVYLLVYRNFITSVISGMPEPGPSSTDNYIWTYRTLHAMDRRFSPYRLHRSFWKVFEYKEDGKEGLLK